uniref:dehydration-responsive element-binding protein 1E-like n=1 Tax=Erigeron canadensis TaxID=72917 RepID=UPI001CB95535|nr:dehydration-responsive element-binding protein 1E-like [Erigeron canadensis]
MDSFVESKYIIHSLSPIDHHETTTTSSLSTSDYSSEPEVLMLASENPKKPAGRKKFKVTRHPVYRGVRSRNNGKWVCEVRHPDTQSRVWLGTHPNAEMAARAHDVAVLAMRGPSACLNFRDSVYRLPVPESSKIKDIQKAAAKAAEAFRYTEVVVVIEQRRPEISNNNNYNYMDEEEVFGMPGFFASMAEALMVPPLIDQTVGYTSSSFVDNNMDIFVDMSLWNV